MNYSHLSDKACKAYNDAVRYAVTRAVRDPISVRVCRLDDAFFVLDQDAVKPEHAKLVCIAQRWDDKTVQLRFDGAHSEWVGVKYLSRTMSSCSP